MDEYQAPVDDAWRVYETQTKAGTPTSAAGCRISCGSALVVLLPTLVWSAILTERWHQARNHAQQTAAVSQAKEHLEAAASQLAAITKPQSQDDARRTLAYDVRAAVPDHTARIQDTARNPAPNPAAEAARLRSPAAASLRPGQGRTP